MPNKLQLQAKVQVPEWTIRETIQLCWTTWLVFLATPFIVLPFALHLSPSVTGHSSRPDIAEIWFRILSVFLVVGLIASGLIRWRLFRRLLRAHDVAPRSYYFAMFIPWALVAAVGLVAELVCIETGTFFPSIIPALFALFIYATLWPTGRPMQPQSFEVPFESMRR